MTQDAATPQSAEPHEHDSSADRRTVSDLNSANGSAKPPIPGARWRRILFGPPISTLEQEHTQLSKRIALPVFSSDAISSVAYATQEILLALGFAGLALAGQEHTYSAYLWAVTAAIVGLLVIVAFSYRQTIFAYPSGGGSYIVTKRNLGILPGLIAGAALLIDYVLTVSVSVAAGVQNLVSIPAIAHLNIGPTLICLFFIAILTVANLRGLKESGTIFALPTYLFIVMAFALMFFGLAAPPLFGWQVHMTGPDAVNQTLPPDYPGVTAHPLLGIAAIALALRAFANGCSAMTGTEAISNGIPAFRSPQSKNAAQTLTWMALILGALFVGTSALAVKFHVVYWEYHGESANAVIDQLSGAVFGRTGPFAWLYYTMQFATMGILVLAANTSFADFPRLASILANDRFLPRELAHRGDRLVFGRGIMLLGFFAALLILVFNGNVDRLIPLYALGVFTAFTFSQSGMVVHWFREKGLGWQGKAVVNGIGAVVTAIVFAVILWEKAPEGAWIVVVVAGILVALFKAIHHRYVTRARGLTLGDAVPGGIDLDAPEHGGARHKTGAAHSTHAGAGSVGTTEPAEVFRTPGSSIIRNMPDAPRRNTVLVLVPGIHKGVLPALNYARLLTPTFRAIYIELDPDHTPQVEASWNRHVPDVPLVVIPSPYRSLVQPLLQYVDKVTDEFDDDVVTLIIPEAFSGNLLDTLLRSTAAAQIKFALLGREDVVVVNVRYRLVD